jgi:hypothetical protein
MLLFDELRIKACFTTFNAIPMVAVMLPEVPVTITLPVPIVALELAVNVRMLVPVVETGLKDAVTPLGRPDATRLTLPVNPP